MKAKATIVSLLLIATVAFLPSAQASIAITPEFSEPLGPSYSWSFEADGYWSTPGGYRSSSYKTHGTYSWYTSAGGAYLMHRSVSSSALSAIAGKTVLFSFWFLPETVSSDGSQNQARAEIGYTLTASGGGGGGGSVAHGSLITMADGSKLPVQQVKVGSSILTYNVTTGEEKSAMVKDIRAVTTDSLLTIQTTARLPLRIDANPHLNLNVLEGGHIALKPATAIGAGDQVFNHDEMAWVSVTRVNVAWGGKHVMYDLYTEPMLDYIANGYPDCPCVKVSPPKDGTSIQAQPDSTYVESNIVSGLWEGPTRSDWYVAKVIFNVPSNIASMTVYIHGQPNFKAYVDSASLAIVDIASTSVTQGKFGLGLSLYEWRRVQGLTYDGHVSLVPAIYAESNPGYFVKDMRITVELQPTTAPWDWGCFCYKTQTSQQGKLAVLYVQQLNDQGHIVDPAATEQANTAVLNAFVWVVDVAAGVGLSIIGPEGTVTGSIFGDVAGTVIGSAVVYLLTGSATSADDPNANGGADYSVTEFWSYYYSFRDYEPEKFVRSATGHYEMNWDFNTGADTSFVIKITGTTTWGTRHTVCPNQSPFCTTDLNSAGVSTLTTYLTVYA